MTFDRVIIGAGIYGLYAAVQFAKQGHSVLVLECDSAPFTRASYVNQARLHNGYHYPRAFSTAITTAKYFERFAAEFKASINNEFVQIYATSAEKSLTNKEQFIDFCKKAEIRCDNINPEEYFKANLCDGAYLTKEYSFDSETIKTQLLDELSKHNSVEIRCNTTITNITQGEAQGDGSPVFTIQAQGQTQAAQENRPPVLIETGYVLNTTYASVNQIQAMAGLGPFHIKYEICELVLCKVSDCLKNTGITVMDGPFFSLMPFGNTGYHTLSSVTYSPHVTSYDTLPTFDCQKESDGFCSPRKLGNCNKCPVKPKSAWEKMSALAVSYLKPEYKIEYIKSIFSIKPILIASEIDDSRPTLVKKFTENPTFVSVLSGKINTIYDMDDLLRL